MAKIVHMQGFGCDSTHDTVKHLTKLNIIVSIPYRSGHLVARYGVNKTALYRYAKKLDGVK